MRASGETIFVQSLETGERKPVAQGSSPRYVASGHILYAQGASLYALPFDIGRMAVTGPPVLALQGIRRRPLGTAEYAVSRSGTLAYMPSDGSESRDSIVWTDRSGNEQPTALSARAYRQPRLSPDGSRVVVVAASQGFGEEDLWLHDLQRNTQARFTTGGGSMPLWSPDGRQVAYMGGPGGGDAGISAKLLDGHAPDRKVVSLPGNNFPLSWSPDGRYLAFVRVVAATANDIWIADTTAGTNSALVATPFREGGATFSPDGRFLAYVSDASGRNEIYVRPFPGPGPEVVVSSDGGNEPIWARRAPELFYRQGDAVMSVDIATTPSLHIGKPKRLFEQPFKRSNALWSNYDVTPDGRRFLFVKGGPQGVLSHFNVVLNWTPP
jgi:dipeptidyl aminopeptidase/acylaminoacyl peptidase